MAPFTGFRGPGPIFDGGELLSSSVRNRQRSIDLLTPGGLKCDEAQPGVILLHFRWDFGPG